jgi:hypothetical protein
VVESNPDHADSAVAQFLAGWLNRISLNTVSMRAKASLAVRLVSSRAAETTWKRPLALSQLPGSVLGIVETTAG